jgi:adenylate cyclase
MAAPEVARASLPASGERAEPFPADPIPFGDALVELLPRSPGERTDVSVLWVELAHPDSLAAGRSASELGALLGAFFRTVAEVTEARGGYTERDDLCAVLCVFGPLASSTCAADAALAGGRDLRDRLAEELPEVAFGIGVSVGASVAGWIQAARRFEPLTICAPASEARRLCELARGGGQAVLASERALARASAPETARWSSARPAGVARFTAAEPCFATLDVVGSA